MRDQAKLVCGVMALCLVFLASKNVNADPVTFTLTNPIQSGTVGTVLTFMGSLTNVAPPTATIVGDNFNGLPVTLTLDDTPFVVNFLGQSIAGGATLGPLSIFTVTIEAGTAPGIYNGVFSVLFDSDNGAGQETNFQTFSITVQGPNPVPEPMTVWLLGSGLVGIVSFKFKRRSKL
jgi:PEP-CTERM motif